MIIISQTCTKIALIRSTFLAKNAPNVVWRAVSALIHWRILSTPSHSYPWLWRDDIDNKGRVEVWGRIGGKKRRERLKEEAGPHRSFQKSALMLTCVKYLNSTVVGILLFYAPNEKKLSCYWETARRSVSFENFVTLIIILRLITIVCAVVTAVSVCDSDGQVPKNRRAAPRSNDVSDVRLRLRYPYWLSSFWLYIDCLYS